MSAISYHEAKAIVLARLQRIIESLPVAERSMPRIAINMRPYSYLDLLREVQMDTDVGRAYVYMVAKQLGYVITG